MVEIIRKSYLETMANYYMGSICTGPWTREWVREIMEIINTDDEVVIRKWNVYETNLKAVYINQLQGNRFALMRILKSSDNASNTVPVVPWEDSFDIIWNAHLVCSHGNLTQTINLIKANYFINLVFVAKLLSGCYCKKEKIVSDLVVHYNIEGSLQILDMTAYPDKEFKYVLVYNDRHTGLIQLRPLVQVSQLEISMELVKIFTDLGPPKKLVVYEPYFYDNVINNVNKVFTPCQIELEFDVILNKNKYKNKLDEVSVMLNSWMKMNKSMNWTIGCNLVQWNMNMNENHGKIPYHLVFGNSIYGKKKVKKKKKKAPKNVSSTVAESISSTESDVECLFTTDSYEGNKNYNETGTNETDTNLDIEDIKLDIEDTNLDFNTNLDIEHTKLNTEETKDNNSMEYVDSQLNLQTEQFGSYQGEYLQFTANYTDKNITKLPNNIATFHQNTEVNIADKDFAMPSDLGFNNKYDFASIEVNAFNNEKNVGQNHTEVTTNKLLKTEYPSVTLSDEAQEETNASCGIKHDNIIETTFICWRCEKEVNCNDKIEDTRMDFTEIICQSCINTEESIT